MKRSKKLIILIGVLVLCIIGYAAANALFSEEALSDSATSLAVIAKEDITSVKWTYNGTQTELLALNENEAESGEEGNSATTWVYAQDEAFPIDSDSAENLVSVLTGLTSIKTVAKTVDDKAKYGIDEPEITITVSSADESVRYYLGNYNESTGYYYLMKSGDDALYYVDSTISTSFSIDIMSLVEYEYPAIINTTDVTSIQLTCGDSTLSIRYYPDGKDGYSEKYNYFFDHSGSVCDTDEAENMIDSFISLDWASCVAYNITEDDLAQYGLDNPSVSVTMNYTYTVDAEDETGEDETFSGSETLLIGSEAETSATYYAMLKGGNCIYTVDESVAKTYMVSSETTLYSKTILDFSDYELDSISVTISDSEYLITAEEEITDDDSEMIYQLDGTDIDASALVEYLVDFTAETIQESDITDVGDILMSLTLNFTDGSRKNVVIYEYDDDFCAVSCDGLLRYFVSENDCDDIYDEFRKLVKSAEETTE